ncbi:type I-E CRISPR-associated protein Cas7/Cse4/CasC [Maridesulfovibrio sp.]|uniref:type I-E CRISPR-associated protein Cas7/Cse4/CasC n=1 Tax=Maridesulfovibrio sp. TaxID=2795000 RepID=UPI002A187DC6|nr:type I-E CRISPR-associated protein Cas7/Cse4/CasC [Maridesulfovibrio sp.]
MSRFIQLHILTSYPASNLNRDDLGRPKTVIMGDPQRLRVSSQSLKRAWRTSEVFQDALAGNLGIRTKEIGKYVYRALLNGAALADVLKDFDAAGSLARLKDKDALAIGRSIGGVFGKLKPEAKKKDADEQTRMESLETEQLAHLSPEELKLASALVEECRESGKEPSTEQLELLCRDCSAADVALFGRMLASSNRHNIEAAAQVAHAMTVHKAAVEDDFFTAVDDLNRDDAGAGHLGVTEFGAGLFYLYLCVDRELLKENLGGDAGLADRAVAALVNAACTVSPSGKQNSFGSRAWASYCLAEKGDIQPRNLSVAYLKPLGSSDRYGEKPDSITVEGAVKRLEDQRTRFNEIYNVEVDSCSFGPAGGTIADVLDFIRE